MKTRTAAILVLSLPLAAGCASVTTALGGTLTVSDVELASLPPSAKEELAPERSALAEAAKELAGREADVRDAEREVEIATWSLRRAEAGLKMAELRFERAQETKDADAMLPARAVREDAQRAVRVAETELDARRSELDFHEARVAEAKAARRVADAKLQLARLNALLGADESVTPEQAKRRARFESQVAERKASLVSARARVGQAERAKEKAEEAWRVARASASTDTTSDKTSDMTSDKTSDKTPDTEADLPSSATGGEAAATKQAQPSPDAE